jgi:hypothetical protein
MYGCIMSICTAMEPDKSALVLSIIFNNEKALSDIDKNACQNILRTFSRDVYECNNSIVNMAIKCKCKHMFDRIKKNTEGLSLAYYSNDVMQKHECCKKEKGLVAEALLCTFATYFKMYFLSEYKELIHESMFDATFKEKDACVVNEIERIVKSMYEWKDIYEYKHDDTHFLFADSLYEYYERYEKKGFNILDDWDYDIADDE